MSLSYSTSGNLSFDAYYATLILSDRDASANIPINFINYPAADVTAVCFGNGTYENLIAQQCISNLLALQFRRLVYDIYWEPVNRQYQLCPVAYPPIERANTTTRGGLTLSLARMPANAAPTSSTSLTRLDKRQNATTTSTSVQSSNSTTQITTTATSSAPYTTFTNAYGDTIIQAGQYSCNTDLTLNSILSLYNSYIQNTSATIDGRLLFLDFRLHAAILPSNISTSSPTLTGSQLPASSELVSSAISNSSVDNFVYTPPDLQSQRQNLNSSWLNSRWESSFPVQGYESTYPISGGDVATTNGWPTEQWLVFSQSKRLITSWLEVDLQMAGYNLTADQDKIFSMGYTTQDRVVSRNSNGQITSGCFYSPGQVQPTSNSNSSWAVSSVDQVSTANFNSSSGFNIVANFTACGISPFLNTTLGGSGAYEAWQPYQVFAQAAASSWGYGQPATMSSFGLSSSTPDSSFRCAVIDSSNNYNGRWRVEDCNNRFRVACRVNNQPYGWTITENAVVYNDAPNQCSGMDAFAYPRTELENTYLYNRVLNTSLSRSDTSLLSGVWINYNSIDVEACWVTGGPQANCPYLQDPGEKRQREVLIPTIAALITLIITVLTILIKCKRNRTSSKKRRRADNGWDYEGVPS